MEATSAHVTNVSSIELLTDATALWIEGFGTNKTPAITSLQWKAAFLPLDVASLLSMVVLLSGILSNVFLGLYIGEKCHNRRCGIRPLLCNQILANLIALFSYSFAPIQVLDKQPVMWNTRRLCQVMPSMGFIGVSVSLTNVAALCVSYYRGKKNGKFAILSLWTSSSVVVGSWLLAVALTMPLSLSLTTVDVKVNQSGAVVCAAVWLDEHTRDVYMNCVFILKYAFPMLVVLSVCLKTELLNIMRKTTTKTMQQCQEITAVLIDVLAVTCLLLLVYFFPLSAMGKGRFLSRNPGVDDAVDIVRILEVVALVNCAIVPMLLAAFVDEYCRSEFTKVSATHLQSQVDKESPLPEYPGNASYVTYDALIADMPEKWRPSPSDVLIV